MPLINLQRAFLAFWSQFGVKAFLEGNAVEYDAQGNAKPPVMPYITFSFPRNDILTSGIATARVWTRSESYLPVLGILELIEKAVPVTGTMLRLDGGGMVQLYRGSPFIQHQPQPEEDQLIKVAYIVLEARSYIM